MNLQDLFLKWMTQNEGKSPNTANAYLSGVRQIQKHYNKISNEDIDFFNIEQKEILKLKSIAKDYDYGGSFEAIGNSGNRTYINGLITYIRFLNYWFSDENQNFRSEQILSAPLITEESLLILFLQKAEILFPQYSVKKEYSKGNSIVLESSQGNELVIIELVAGIAKSDSFGHIAATMGEMSELFPKKTIIGIIIASNFDKTLIAATRTNKNVCLKTYSLDLTIQE